MQATVLVRFLFNNRRNVEKKILSGGLNHRISYVNNVHTHWNIVRLPIIKAHKIDISRVLLHSNFMPQENFAYCFNHTKIRSDRQKTLFQLLTSTEKYSCIHLDRSRSLVFEIKLSRGIAVLKCGMPPLIHSLMTM